jgi:hypothetical protein
VSGAKSTSATKAVEVLVCSRFHNRGCEGDKPYVRYRRSEWWTTPVFVISPKTGGNTIAGSSCNRNHKNNFACSFITEVIGERPDRLFTEVPKRCLIS